MELAGAYATFAAGGTYDEPRLVVRIVGPDGKDVPLPEPPPPRRVLDDAEAYVMTSMLTSVIDHGTGVRAKSLGRPLAGKTGTSNGPKDTWFAGYSADIAASCGSATTTGAARQRRAGRGDGAAGVDGVHEGGARGQAARRVLAPAGRRDGRRSTRRTGELPYPDDPDVLDEVFLAGTEPTVTAEPPAPSADDSGDATDAGAP